MLSSSLCPFIVNIQTFKIQVHSVFEMDIKSQLCCCPCSPRVLQVACLLDCSLKVFKILSQITCACPGRASPGLRCRDTALSQRRAKCCLQPGLGGCSGRRRAWAASPAPVALGPSLTYTTGWPAAPRTMKPEPGAGENQGAAVPLPPPLRSSRPPPSRYHRSVQAPPPSVRWKPRV